MFKPKNHDLTRNKVGGLVEGMTQNTVVMFVWVAGA